MKMGVQRNLNRINEILESLKTMPNVADITHYNVVALDIFQSTLKRVIRHYESEAKRVKKYYR